MNTVSSSNGTKFTFKSTTSNHPRTDRASKLLILCHGFFEAKTFYAKRGTVAVPPGKNIGFYVAHGYSMLLLAAKIIYQCEFEGITEVDYRARRLERLEAENCQLPIGDQKIVRDFTFPMSHRIIYRAPQRIKNYTLKFENDFHTYQGNERISILYPMMNSSAYVSDVFDLVYDSNYSDIEFLCCRIVSDSIREARNE